MIRCSHLAKELDDALVHDLLREHLLHVQLPDELDVTQHAAASLQIRLHRPGPHLRIQIPSALNVYTIFTAGIKFGSEGDAYSAPPM